MVPTAHENSVPLAHGRMRKRILLIPEVYVVHKIPQVLLVSTNKERANVAIVPVMKGKFDDQPCQ